MKIKTIEVRGHPGFFCSSDGTVIGKRGKPMIGHIDRCGYREVLFYENGSTKNLRVHRIILENFCPVEGMEKLQVNHKNGIKTDNRLENLEWCTRSENLLHAYRNGLERKCKGYKHHAHALTKEMVDDIKANCELNSKEKGITAFAKKYGVHYQTIANAYHGRTYDEN